MSYVLIISYLNVCFIVTAQFLKDKCYTIFKNSAVKILKKDKEYAMVRTVKKI